MMLRRASSNEWCPSPSQNGDTRPKLLLTGRSALPSQIYTPLFILITDAQKASGGAPDALSGRSHSFLLCRAKERHCRVIRFEALRVRKRFQRVLVIDE